MILPLARRAVFAAFAAAAIASHAQTIQLKISGVAPSASTYEATSNVNISGAGQEMELTSTEEMRVVLLEALNGVHKFERTILSSVTSVGGQEMPSPEGDPDVAVYLIDSRGVTLSYEDFSGDEPDPEMDSIGHRVGQTSEIIFPEGPIGKGEKWTYKFRKDPKLGTEDATGTYTFTGLIDIEGTQAAEIDFVYAETSGETKIKASGKTWVEVASGDVIKQEFSFSNVPFDMGPDQAIASGDTAMKRTGGSFLTIQEQSDKPEEKPEEEKPKEGPIDKKVKDHEKLDGYFTVYTKEDRGRTKYLLELKEDQLGEFMMLQTTASTGTSDKIVAGTPAGDIMFKFQRMPGKKLYMVVPNYRFRARESAPISEAVKRSFSDSYVHAFTIDAEQDDRLLIDVTAFFTSNIGQVYEMASGGGGGGPLAMLGGGLSPDREKTFIENVKSFPENLYVESIYSFRGAPTDPTLATMIEATLADTRSASIKVSYLLMPLDKEDGYRERRFDPRIGYFTTHYQDFTDDTATDQKVVNITRWRLKKKNPEAEISEPVKPIVWWLDSAIPNRHKPKVREALLAWNSAFKKIGYKKAIVVKDMPDDGSIDHADVRYNTVRWVASPNSAYAVSQTRVNPMTGELINASITVDAGIARTFGGEYEVSIDPAAVFKTDKQRLEDALKMKLNGLDCQAAQMGWQQAALGLMASERLSEGSPIDRSEFIGQFIRWVTMHEFGHCLGLRHHFSSSGQLDMEQLADGDLVAEKGAAASVMDYVPFNPAAIEGGVDFWSKGLGEYDYLAIEYGYDEFGRLQADHELPDLTKIASRTVKRGLGWQGDEFADMIDPYVTRFDLSAKPLDYWGRIMELSRTLLFSLDEHSPKDGQSYYTFTREFNILMSQYANGASRAMQYIGGVKRTPGHLGDGQSPAIAPIDASEQREALEIINERIFSEDALAFPKRYYKMFTPNPKADLMNSIMHGLEDYPMLDSLSGLQGSAIRTLLSSSTLRRVANHEFEAEENDKPLKLRELLGSVKSSVWSEFRSGRKVSPLRRQLQRDHISALIRVGVQSGSRTEVNVQAWGSLKELLVSLKASKGRFSDPDSKLHIDDSIMRTERALNAIETIGGSGGGTPSSLLDMLLGG